MSKAIDKAAGAEREATATGSDGAKRKPRAMAPGGAAREAVQAISEPVTSEAERWQGWGTALKPAHEPVVCAQKPLSVVPLDDGLLDYVHHALSALVCLLSYASDADTSSMSSPAGLPEATCVSARASAYLESLSAESEQTAMPRSPGAASTALSIASSWSAILGAILRGGSRSTTEIATRLTTALTTLSSSLSPITSHATMPRCGCLTSGRPPSADTAAESSSAGWTSWLDTLRRTVPEPAWLMLAQSVASTLASIAGDPSRPLPATGDATAQASAPTGLTMPSGGSGSVPVGDAAQPMSPSDPLSDSAPSTAPTSECRSPAHEPIVVARKPLVGTVAKNVVEHGTGALNVDGCRVETAEILNGGAYSEDREPRAMAPGGAPRSAQPGKFRQPAGRWPPNVVLDEEAAELLDEQTGELKSGDLLPGHQRGQGTHTHEGGYVGGGTIERAYGGDSGGASRFFPTFPADATRFRYCPKSSQAERNAGLPEGERSSHPTVKPLALMRWFVRLVTPPGGRILDPFAGSGTTGIAALLEGFDFLGIEREPEYVEVAKARLAWWEQHPEGVELVDRLAAEEQCREAVDAGQLDLFGEAA